MIQIKKTILTLVALLAVTTGAWAEEQSETITTATKGTTVYTGTHFKITASYNCDADGIYLFSNNHGTATIESLNGENITKIEMHMTYGGRKATKTTTTAGQLVATDSSESANDISVINVNATSVEIGTTVEALDGTVVQIDKFVIYYGAASSGTAGPKVAWDKATKTGQFTMPGGNVTLEPDYYPQATAADGAVTAADDDARATTDDPLVKVDATKLTGAKKLMYFVSNSGTTAPAYDAEGWTDQLPTAEGITEAGIVFVWYYPVGTDEGDADATATYSDGDMNATALSVNIADAPTYAVTFAEGTPETGKWTASPNTGVKKGQTVTVTYTGTKKVIGVKAEKKKAAEKTITIGEQNYTVLNGETWKQFITRNQLSGWYLDQMTLSTWGVYINEPFSKLHVSSDGTNWTQLVLSSQDAPIDTDKQYKWVQEEIGGGGAPF